MDSHDSTADQVAAPPSPSETPPPPGAKRRLERPRDDRIIAGVAAGLARYFNVPHWAVILVFVLLVPAGGLGVLLYAAGWLLIPDEGRDQSTAEGWVSSADEVVMWVGGGLVVVGILVAVSWLGLVNGKLLWAVALIVGGVLLYRGGLNSRSLSGDRPPSDQSGSRLAPAATASDATAAAATAAAATASTAAPATLADSGSTVPAAATSAAVSTAVVPAPPPPTGSPRPSGSPAFPPPPPPTAAPPAPRHRSILGRLTAGTVLLVLGVMAVFDVTDVADVRFRHYLAAALVVLGGGLVVGTFFGRSRALIVFGLLIIPVLLAASIVRIPLDAGFGERNYAPPSAAIVQEEYVLGMGKLVVDLSDAVPGDRPITTKVRIGMGEVIVDLPDGVPVVVNGELVAGELVLLDSRNEGFDLEDRVTKPGAGEPLFLTVEGGFGSIKVFR